MYRKNLIVFFLCTALVVGFVVVLNYESTEVNRQIQSLPTEQSSCSAGDPNCPSFSIISASLRTQNTTDQLGTASPTYLTLELNISGGAPLATIHLFVGNTSAGTVQGPFNLGVERIVNLTLPATVTVSPGRTYKLSVEGINSTGAFVVRSERVTAQGQLPYSA